MRPQRETKQRSWMSALFGSYGAEHDPQAARAQALAARFQPYRPPPGVVPESARMAHDSASSDAMAQVQGWATSQVGAQMAYLEDGLGFMGYPYLAQMAQRPEFRKPCDVLAREATREWIILRTAHGDEDEARTEKIQTLEEDLKRYDIRRLVHRHVLDGLLYGVAHLWVDSGSLPKDAQGQNTPLTLTEHGFKKGDLRGFKTIDPVWTTPNTYNADNPLQDDYYRPRTWWVQGCLVHRDRLKTTVPYEVSDLFKPAFNFGGLSLTQQLRSYVHNFLRTRNSVSDITANFSKLVLKTDMSSVMQGGMLDQSQTGTLTGRALFMQQASEGQSTIIADKESEEVSVVATPLGGLSDLQAQAMEAMASIPGIPLVKLFGITPNGLNASSEGEIRVFYDEIAAFQEANLRPVLEWVLKILQLNRWGTIDETIRFDFAPLWQLDDEKSAAVERQKAETDKINIEIGKITPDEARQREAQDDHSLYRGVDLNGEAPGIPETEPPTLGHGDDGGGMGDV